MVVVRYNENARVVYVSQGYREIHLITYFLGRRVFGIHIAIMCRGLRDTAKMSTSVIKYGRRKLRFGQFS